MRYYIWMNTTFVTIIYIGISVFKWSNNLVLIPLELSTKGFIGKIFLAFMQNIKKKNSLQQFWTNDILKFF